MDEGNTFPHPTGYLTPTPTNSARTPHSLRRQSERRFGDLGRHERNFSQTTEERRHKMKMYKLASKFLLKMNVSR